MVGFEIGVGDRIAQLVLECIRTPTITEDPKLEMPALNPFNPSSQSSSTNGAMLVDLNCSLSPYLVTNPTTPSSLAWSGPPMSSSM